jgi:hypothetical protein
MWVRQWWNGRWGRTAHKHLYVYASPWRVEARAGGADGASSTYRVDDLAAAEALAVEFMEATDDEWRELTVRPEHDRGHWVCRTNGVSTVARSMRAADRHPWRSRLVSSAWPSAAALLRHVRAGLCRLRPRQRQRRRRRAAFHRRWRRHQRGRDRRTCRRRCPRNRQHAWLRLWCPGAHPSVGRCRRLRRRRHPPDGRLPWAQRSPTSPPGCSPPS